MNKKSRPPMSAIVERLALCEKASEEEFEPEQQEEEYSKTNNDCNALRETEFTPDIPYQELIVERRLGESDFGVVYAG